MKIDEAFTHFPLLITDRLRLRPVQEADAEALFAIKSDLEVTRRYGQEPHRSIEDTLRWIHRLQADYERREAIFWVLTLKGEDRLIGAVTFWNFEHGYYSVELGYELHPAFWKQGIMTEAITAVLTYGFREFGLNRVEAVPLVENISSRNLLLKLGFTLEGVLRQRIFFRDHFIDQEYYGLLRDDQNAASYCVI